VYRHLIVRGRQLAPDLSITDPTPGGATAHGESEDHHSRDDDCDRDPEDGSTKNSLHDGRPCLESWQSSRITVSPLIRAPSEIGSRSGLPVRMGRHADHRNRAAPDCPVRLAGTARPPFRGTEARGRTDDRHRRTRSRRLRAVSRLSTTGSKAQFTLMRNTPRSQGWPLDRGRLASARPRSSLPMWFSSMGVCWR